jgi:hypothetical protein
MRENSDCWAGGGRFSIDFPGIGMVTADDEGEHDELDEAMDIHRFTDPLIGDGGRRPSLSPLNFVYGPSNGSSTLLQTFILLDFISEHHGDSQVSSYSRSIFCGFTWFKRCKDSTGKVLQLLCQSF